MANKWHSKKVIASKSNTFLQLNVTQMLLKSVITDSQSSLRRVWKSSEKWMVLTSHFKERKSQNLNSIKMTWSCLGFHEQIGSFHVSIRSCFSHSFCFQKINYYYLNLLLCLNPICPLSTKEL